jgi:hypothetical protein
MELSLEDMMRSILKARNGPMMVKLPRPERYALHKLLVYADRPQARRTKARKDVAQAAVLIDYLLVHEAAEIAALWKDVNARVPGWRKRLEHGFQVMNALCPACDFGDRLGRVVG